MPKKQKKVEVKDYKRTKILATLGPSTNSYEFVKQMIESGANGIRLNFSHGSHEERIEHVEWIRKASKELGKPVAILQDLQGPKIRLGDFEGEIKIKKGQSLSFQLGADYEDSGLIPIQYDLSKKVKRGERMYLFDGKVRCIIDSVKDGVVYATAQNSGYVVKRKGLNLPDTDFSGDVITEKDKKDAAFGSTLDIDLVAQSFVQSAQDVRELKKILKNLGSSAKVVAKIETVAALANIEEVIQESDMIMVARGDLAVETAPERVPIEQRRIVGLCRKYEKPVIIATQMLASMTDSDEPTRAEVSDVATAAIIGSDCVMLSDETASGDYPIAAVKMMKRILTYTEKQSPVEAVFRDAQDYEKIKSPQQSAITSAIITLSQEVRAVAIVAETKSGATALKLASRRPSEPIIAVTSDQRVSNQLALVYSVKSYVRPDHRKAASKLTDWMVKENILHKGDVVVSVSGQYPGVVGTTDTIKVRKL